MDPVLVGGEIFGIDTDPGYWLDILAQAGTVIGLGMMVGGPVGWWVWRRTRRPRRAVVLSLVAAAVWLVVYAYLYFTIVLCPPTAGCA